MLDLVYKGEDKIYPITFDRLSDHIVEITGDFPVKTVGFTLSRTGMEDNWNYGGFTTIYREIEGGAQFSDDGTVYVEPEPDPEPEVPDPPEPYIPTLEEVQEAKVSEMNSEMERVIAYGVPVTLTDGTQERFTLTDRDQLSLMGLQVSAAILSAQNSEQTPFMWHPADESVHCKFYSEEDMKKISAAGFQYVLYHVTYFRDLRIYIRSLTDKGEVKAIVYGDKIPEEYQSEPLKMMIAAQSV